MSSVFHLKKKQIYKNKFHSLINQAYPGVFAEDLGKDMNHHQLSLDNFRVLDYEEKGRKHKHKGRIPRVQSFNDLSANDRPYYTITESSQEPCRIIDRVRRKSCSCSYCGQANLGVNLKQAMQIVNPEFYISESWKIRPDHLKTNLVMSSSINLRTRKQFPSVMPLILGKRNSTLINNNSIADISSSSSAIDEESKIASSKTSKNKKKKKITLTEKFTITDVLPNTSKIIKSPCTKSRHPNLFKPMFIRKSTIHSPK